MRRLSIRLYAALAQVLLLAACGSAPVAPVPVVLAQARNESVAANRVTQNHDWDGAIEHWQRALQLYASVDDWSGQGEARLGLANAYALRGQRDLARKTLAGMLEQPLFTPIQRTQVAYQLSLLAMPDAASALGYLKQAQLLCASQCALSLQLTNLDARIHLAQGDAQGALVIAQSVLARPGDVPRAEQAHAWRLAAEARLVLGDAAGGWRLLQQALQVDRDLAQSEYLADDLALQKRLGKAMADKAVEEDAIIRLQSLCAAVPAKACATF